jgi:hypothetical protein
VSPHDPAVAQPGRASESGEKPDGDAVDLRRWRGPLSLSGVQQRPESGMMPDGMSPVQIRPAGPNFRFRAPAMFAKLHRACGFPKLVRIAEAYPDIIAVDENGRQSKIEVEFESATFEREHTGEADKCDFIVCWRDTGTRREEAGNRAGQHTLLTKPSWDMVDNHMSQ